MQSVQTKTPSPVTYNIGTSHQGLNVDGESQKLQKDIFS